MKKKHNKTTAQCRNSSKTHEKKCREKQKSIPLAHKYMRAHFPGLIQVLQYRVAVLNQFYMSNLLFV